MDWDKILETIIGGLKVAVPSVLMGVVGTYLVYDTVVLEAKKSEISTLKTAVDVEKGRQSVLNERIKLLGDKAVFLEKKLDYKPSTEAEKEQEYLSTIEKLKKENTELEKLKDSFEKVENNKVNTAELTILLDQYIAENNRLKKIAANYSSEVIVDEYHISEGGSWSGFGGKVTFGISKIDNDYKKGAVAQAVSSIFSVPEKEVQPGNVFDFTIGNEQYTLIINKVAYIGDFVLISVHKKI